MKDWEWLGWWLDGKALGDLGELVVCWWGLMRPEGKRFSGESQQNAAGCLEDLGLWA